MTAYDIDSQDQTKTIIFANVHSFWKFHYVDHCHDGCSHWMGLKRIFGKIYWG